MTPSKAIRAKCLECVGGEPGQLRRCTARAPQGKCDPSGCHLWPYRLGGKRDGSHGHKRASRIKAIKAECDNCMGGVSGRAGECDCEDCPVRPYREGKDPFRKGHDRKPVWLHSHEPKAGEGKPAEPGAAVDLGDEDESHDEPKVANA